MTVEVRRRGGSERAARALLDSVRADTPDFVHLAVEGSELVIRLEAKSAASARATLEDLLACLKAAESATGSASE